MSINYQYLLKVIERSAERNPSASILDYGCGRGEIVRSARLNGIKIYGADTYSHGSSLPKILAKDGLLGDVIFEIREDKLHFNDNSFDLVISNQVFEHVQNLDRVLKEINRVLKPEGELYALFPPKEIIREGHTGIPFLHWFPKTRIRYFYTMVLRFLGLGTSTNNPSDNPREWAIKKTNYIDNRTCYRKAREINALFDNYFIWQHREEELINFRAKKLNNLIGKFIFMLMKIPGIKQVGIYAFSRLAGFLIVAVPKKTQQSQ